jgi:YhgE/Pip-like protein
VSDSPSPAGSTRPPGDALPVRVRQLLKTRALWISPLIVGSIVVALLTAFYIGSVVNPAGHLHGLPVAIVNQDRGATTGTQRVDFGQQVQAGLSRSPSVADPLGLADTTLRAAEQVMDRDGSYAAVVIPAGFSASLLELAGEKASGPGYRRPEITILTNQRTSPLNCTFLFRQPHVCVTSGGVQQRYSVILVRSSQALVTPPARATITGPTRT